MSNALFFLWYWASDFSHRLYCDDLRKLRLLVFLNGLKMFSFRLKNRPRFVSWTERSCHFSRAKKKLIFPTSGSFWTNTARNQSCSGWWSLIWVKIRDISTLTFTLAKLTPKWVFSVKKKIVKHGRIAFPNNGYAYPLRTIPDTMKVRNRKIWKKLFWTSAKYYLPVSKKFRVNKESWTLLFSYFPLLSSTFVRLNDDKFAQTKWSRLCYRYWVKKARLIIIVGRGNPNL